VVVRVKPAYPTGQIRLWGSDDGQAWRYLVSSKPFLDARLAGTDYPEYRFALEYLPTWLRVGVTGPHLGRIGVDDIAAAVDGSARPVLELRTVGEVLASETALGADGRAAVFVHRGQADVVDGLVARFEPSPPPPSQRAPTMRYGTYTSPGQAEDRRADAIAWWDFTVFQQGQGLAECVRKVKQRNPAHRVVLRLFIPGDSLLMYTLRRAFARGTAHSDDRPPARTHCRTGRYRDDQRGGAGQHAARLLRLAAAARVVVPVAA
jgi:hypothetical protein